VNGDLQRDGFEVCELGAIARFFADSAIPEVALVNAYGYIMGSASVRLARLQDSNPFLQADTLSSWVDTCAKSDPCKEPRKPARKQSVIRAMIFIGSSFHGLSIAPGLTYMFWQQIRQTHEN
jgi:hypothetical protein